jgi:hypothetical protein
LSDVVDGHRCPSSGRPPLLDVPHTIQNLAVRLSLAQLAVCQPELIVRTRIERRQLDGTVQRQNRLAQTIASATT